MLGHVCLDMCAWTCVLGRVVGACEYWGQLDEVPGRVRLGAMCLRGVSGGRRMFGGMLGLARIVHNDPQPHVDRGLPPCRAQGPIARVHELAKCFPQGDILGRDQYQRHAA